ncbi:PAH2 domain-containing protein, partial [Exidia glandulosa HHB12029]
LDVEDALAYLDRVKHEFLDTPEMYNRFLDIMKRFKAGQIDTPQAVAQITELFEGRSELIEGFNVFLPSGYHID